METANDSGRESGIVLDGRDVHFIDPDKARWTLEGIRDIHADNASTETGSEAAKAKRLASGLTELINKLPPKQGAGDITKMKDSDLQRWIDSPRSSDKLREAAKAELARRNPPADLPHSEEALTSARTKMKYAGIDSGHGSAAHMAAKKEYERMVSENAAARRGESPASVSNNPKVGTNDYSKARAPMTTMKDIMAKSRKDGLPPISVPFKMDDGRIMATDRFRAFIVSPDDKHYGDIEALIDDANLDPGRRSAFESLDKIIAKHEPNMTTQLDLSQWSESEDPIPKSKKTIPVLDHPNGEYRLNKQYVESMPKGSTLWHNGDPRQPVLVKNEDGKVVGLLMPRRSLKDQEEKRKESEAAEAERVRQQQEAEATRLAREQRRKEDVDNDRYGTRFNLSALTPAAKGRLDKHMDKLTRYGEPGKPERVMKNSEFYALPQWTTKHASTYRGKDAYYLRSSDTGIMVQIPKMVYDTISLPDGGER